MERDQKKIWKYIFYEGVPPNTPKKFSEGRDDNLQTNFEKIFFGSESDVALTSKCPFKEGGENFLTGLSNFLKGLNPVWVNFQ